MYSKSTIIQRSDDARRMSNHLSHGVRDGIEVQTLCLYFLRTRRGKTGLHGQQEIWGMVISKWYTTRSFLSTDSEGRSPNSTLGFRVFDCWYTTTQSIIVSLSKKSSMPSISEVGRREDETDCCAFGGGLKKRENKDQRQAPASVRSHCAHGHESPLIVGLEEVLAERAGHD